jgi:hypothetical protein
MEYVQTLDPARLVLAGTALSFITAGFGDMTVNFPLYLGGYGLLLVGQQVEGTDALQAVSELQITFLSIQYTYIYSLQLLILLASSTVFDVIHLAASINWFLKLLNVLQLILKVSNPICVGLVLYPVNSQVPTCLSLMMALRSKGNLGIRGSDLNGPTGEFMHWLSLFT